MSYSITEIQLMSDKEKKKHLHPIQKCGFPQQVGTGKVKELKTF